MLKLFETLVSKKGEIFGILGPNGAGKSTTILMLTTLLRITSGTAKINDLDVVKNDSEVRDLSLIHISEPRDRTRSRMPSSA